MPNGMEPLRTTEIRSHSLVIDECGIGNVISSDCATRALALKRLNAFRNCHKRQTNEKTLKTYQQSATQCDLNKAEAEKQNTVMARRGTRSTKIFKMLSQVTASGTRSVCTGTPQRAKETSHGPYTSTIRCTVLAPRKRP